MRAALGAAPFEVAQAGVPREPRAWRDGRGCRHCARLLTRLARACLPAGCLPHADAQGSLDHSLDTRRFVRVHRSTVVNIDLVDERRQDAHGDFVIVLRDRTELRVGRRFRDRLQARLGQPL
jgi:hypothetical protein